MAGINASLFYIADYIYRSWKACINKVQLVEKHKCSRRNEVEANDQVLQMYKGFKKGVVSPLIA